MMYGEVVRDFAHRTHANLNFINRAKNQPKVRVYEVTQLINSMVGLLVFPQQHFIDNIPKTPLSKLEEEGWPSIDANSAYPRCRNLRELVTKLRNSVAHFNIEFLVDNGTIAGVRVWNKYKGKKNWEATLSLKELREITNRFIEVLENEKLIQRG